MGRVPSPVRPIVGRAVSNWPIAARCSSTKSGDDTGRAGEVAACAAGTPVPAGSVVARSSPSTSVSAATNVDPVDAVAKGEASRRPLSSQRFALTLPPLRRRAICRCSSGVHRRFNSRNRSRFRGVDNATMRALEQYNFPGNVRELRNVIERATIRPRSFVG